MSIALTSPAFGANETIPDKFTVEGANVSPPLEWSNIPEGTQQIAMIVDDPDAPREKPFVHWVIYGIPGKTEGLPEDVPQEKTLSEPVEGVQGTNDFGKTGYGGPAPPEGHGVHHYHFKVYALDESLNLEPGKNKEQLLEAIQAHVLAQGELVGTYER